MLKVDFVLYAKILRKSGIIFLSEMSWVITETVMTAVYNGRGGAEIVSGMAAGWTIANLFFLVFGGIHTSVGVIVGVGVNVGSRVAVGVRVFVGVAVIFFAQTLMNMPMLS